MLMKMEKLFSTSLTLCFATVICFLVSSWHGFTNIVHTNQGLSQRPTSNTSAPPVFSAQSAEVFSEQDRVYLERRLQIQRACRGRVEELSPRDDVSRYFSFSPRHRLAYCSVQKVGCSFWIKVMKILTSQRPNGSLFDGTFHHSRGIRGNNSFLGKPASFQQRILQTYKKFLFVRDPYCRLFSGYMDKVFLPSSHLVSLSKMAQKKMATRDATNDSGLHFSCLSYVSFETFLDLVVSGRFKNPHYTPVYEHCDPCHVGFDFIGKMETFMEDTRNILRQGSADLGMLTSDIRTMEEQNDLAIIQDLATVNVGASKTHGNQCCEVFRRVWVTLQTRGIISANVKFPTLLLTYCQSVSSKDFVDTLVDAYHRSVSREERKHQRQDAMMEAFYELPRHLLKRVQEFVQGDCDLFGYECSVEKRFPEQ